MDHHHLYVPPPTNKSRPTLRPELQPPFPTSLLLLLHLHGPVGGRLANVLVDAFEDGDEGVDDAIYLSLPGDGEQLPHALLDVLLVEVEVSVLVYEVVDVVSALAEHNRVYVRELLQRETHCLEAEAVGRCRVRITLLLRID